MTCIKVLVFPGGTEIGLEINRALGDIKNIELYSAGSTESNHAPYVFKHFLPVPPVSEPGWLERLNAVIDRHSIDYVFPAHDDVVVALAAYSTQLKARVVSSPVRTCQITRSKRLTYNELRDVVRVPKIFEQESEDLNFPVFLKPDRGQGSQGIKLATDRRDFDNFAQTVDMAKYVILEYLPGAEFTVDCFSDRRTGLQFCAGRRRSRIRNGIAMDSEIIEDSRFLDIARKINTRLELHGAWFFQVKETVDGELALLEVGPRIAGTMALNRTLGVNFPLLSIYEQMGLPIKILTNQINVRIDRALVNRYSHDLSFSTLYLDLDDTLINREKVNTNVIRFVYQCLNDRKKVVLITKHAGDLVETLKKHRLDALFDSIVHLRAGEKKSDYITETDAIFIDDSFQERAAISETRKIPTFDCSMLEVLIDERT